MLRISSEGNWTGRSPAVRLLPHCSLIKIEAAHFKKQLWARAPKARLPGLLGAKCAAFGAGRR